MRPRAFKEFKNFVLFAGLLIITCLVGGCYFAQSVSPFYLPQDVVFDPSLLGDWQSSDPSDKGGLVIRARTADSYSIESTSYDDDRESEVTWTFEVHRFTYKQNSYLDCFPIAFRVGGKNENFQTDADGMLFLVPVHSVMRLHQDSQKISLTWVGDSQVLFEKEDDAAKAKRLAREKWEHDIMTMPTERLQREVLGAALEGKTVSETEMSFVRKK